MSHNLAGDDRAVIEAGSFLHFFPIIAFIAAKAPAMIQCRERRLPCRRNTDVPVRTWFSDVALLLALTFDLECSLAADDATNSIGLSFAATPSKPASPPSAAGQARSAVEVLPPRTASKCCRHCRRRRYVGSFDEHLYAIDLLTGKEKWKYKAGPSRRRRPCGGDGLCRQLGWDVPLRRCGQGRETLDLRDRAARSPREPTSPAISSCSAPTTRRCTV